MVINKPFKNYVPEFFKKHINQNLEAYVEGTLSVAKRRILTTKWVVDAWEKLKSKYSWWNIVFLKCWLSSNLDGTEDDQKIKIRGIEDYTVPSTEREFTLLEDDRVYFRKKGATVFETRLS